MKHGLNVAILVLAAFAVVGLAGCGSGDAKTRGTYKPGGDGVSRDQFTYESTSWMPQTVTLRDTRTGEAIWSVDIPVGQQLVLRFVSDAGVDDFYPDAMRWEIMRLGKRSGSLSNTVAAPPPTARLLEPTLRPAPEMPGSAISSGNGG